MSKGQIIKAAWRNTSKVCQDRKIIEIGFETETGDVLRVHIPLNSAIQMAETSVQSILNFFKKEMRSSDLDQSSISDITFSSLAPKN